VLRTARGAERVDAIDIFRERVLLKAEDGTTRVATLAELKQEVGGPDLAPPAAAPKQPEAEKKPEREADRALTTQDAVEAVTPKRRRRRGRKKGRRRRDRPGGDDRPGGGDDGDG
jgi:hypothetical protein